VEVELEDGCVVVTVVVVEMEVRAEDVLLEVEVVRAGGMPFTSFDLVLSLFEVS
jgi:hypothetical protein